MLQKSSESAEKFFSAHLNLVKNCFKQAALDISIGMYRYHCRSSVGMAIEAMAPFLAKALKSFFLQEFTDFFGREQGKLH